MEQGKNGGKSVRAILNKQLKKRGDVVSKLEKQGLNITGGESNTPNTSVRRKLEKAMSKTDSKDELLSFGVSRDLLSLVKVNIEVEPVGAVIEGVYILPSEVVSYLEDNADIIKGNGDVGEFLETEYGVKDDYTLSAKIEYEVKLTTIKRVSEGVYNVGGNKLTKTDVFIGDNHWLVNDILFTRDHKDFMNYTRRYIDEYVREDEQATFILEDFIEFLDQSKLENGEEQGKEDIRSEFKNQTKEEVLMELYRVRNNLTYFGLEQIWEDKEN